MSCDDCPKPEATGYMLFVGGYPLPRMDRFQASLPPGADFSHVQVNGDGTIRYEKRAGGWEPPRPIDGYRRDDADHFLFHPEWLPCPHRLFGVKCLLACGCIDVVAVCKHMRSQVMHRDCSECLK